MNPKQSISKCQAISKISNRLGQSRPHSVPNIDLNNGPMESTSGLTKLTRTAFAPHGEIDDLLCEIDHMSCHDNLWETKLAKLKENIDRRRKKYRLRYDSV